MTDEQAADEQESPSERTESDQGLDDAETENPPATPASDESVADDINEAFEPDPAAGS